MVNVEKFAERLKIVMQHYEITAALLAEKVEVQRSSISHILSGRNKPSLEFVLKILKAFPEVELYWLLNGTGKFPKEIIVSIPPSPPVTQKSTKKSTEEAISSINQSDKTTNDIERIVIFYKNGSFKNFNP